MATRRHFLAAVGATTAGGCLSDLPLVSQSTPCETGNIGTVEGSWPTLGGDSGHSGHTQDRGPGPDAETGWCAAVASDRQWTCYPVVAGGRVYLCDGQVEGEASGSGSGPLRDDLLALDASTGEEVWRTTTAGRAVDTPTVADGVVLLAVNAKSGTGVVQAFDAQSGSKEWRAVSENEFGGAPAVAGGIAFVTDRNSTVHAFAVGDGARRWKRRVGVDETTTEEASDANRTAGADGTAETDETTEEKIPDFNVNFGWPATVTGGAVYVAHSAMFGGGFPALYALDAESGWPQWEEFAFLGGLVAASSDAVFGNAFAQQLTSFSTEGGTYWTTKTEKSQTTPPATDGETVYVGGDRLWAFDAGTGEERWTADATTEEGPQPVVTKDAIYVFDGNDRLAVVGKDGTVRGRISGPVEIPFAVADGVLFAVTGLRRLEALVSGERAQTSRT